MLIADLVFEYLLLWGWKKVILKIGGADAEFRKVLDQSN